MGEGDLNQNLLQVNQTSFQSGKEEITFDQAEDIDLQRSISVVQAEQDEQNQQTGGGTQTPLATGFALVNSMIGALMVALPIMFFQTGVISSLLIMGIYCIISTKTSTIYLSHTKKSESDIQQPIRRLLGAKWETCFLITSNVYTFLLNVLYFVMINTMLMKLAAFILIKAGKKENVDFSMNGDKEIILDKFSLQYMCMITAIPFFLSTFIKDLSLLVKISQYGIISLYGYLSFLIYVFVTNFTSHEFNFDNIEWFTFDLGNLAGSAALAFSMHLYYTPITKQNKKPHTNLKVMSYSFLAGYSVYAFIGVMGMFGISGRLGCTREQTTQKFDILQFFKLDDVPSLIVAILYIINLTSCFPVFYSITKERVIYQIYRDDFSREAMVKRKRSTFVLNTFYICFSFVPIFVPSIQPDDIMSFIGAVCGFIIVYVLPTLMHIQCFHGNSTLVQRFKRSLSVVGILQQKHKCTEDIDAFNDPSFDIDRELGTIEEESCDELSSANTSLYQARAQNFGNPKLQDKQQENAKRSMRLESCNSIFHDNQYKKSKNTRVILYSILGLIGIATMIYGLYSLGVSLFTKQPKPIPCAGQLDEKLKEFL